MSVIARRKFLIDGQACDGIIGEFTCSSFVFSYTLSEAAGYDNITFHIITDGGSYYNSSKGYSTIFFYDSVIGKSMWYRSGFSGSFALKSIGVSYNATTGVISLLNSSVDGKTILCNSNSSTYEPVETSYRYIAWKS